MLSEIRGNVFIVTGGAMGLGRGFTEELLKVRRRPVLGTLFQSDMDIFWEAAESSKDGSLRPGFYPLG